MKKKVFGRKLGRASGTRKALFRALTLSLVQYGKITTTKAKGKAILPDIDGMVNLAKEGSTASLRRLYAVLGNKGAAVTELVRVAPMLGDRNSGYTRTINLGTRRGDNAETVRIEWVEDVSVKASAKEKVKKDKKVVKGKVVKATKTVKKTAKTAKTK